MTGFTIRQIKEYDYINIYKLNSNLDYFKIKHFVNDLKSKIIVAQLNDDIVGYVIFNVINTNVYNNELLINEILVDESFRGLGIGHELMVDLEKICKEINVELISTESCEYNDEEKKFFNRHGFRFTDEGKFQKRYCNIWKSMMGKFNFKI